MAKSYSRRNRRSHKKSSHSRKHRRSMKGGSSCTAPSPLNQTGGKRRRHRGTRKVKRGGMMNGIMEATKQALLPFLLFASQKHVQNRVQKKR